MKTAFKRVFSLVMLAVMLSLSLTLMSCSEIEDTIEDFLSASSYTFKTETTEIKVSDSTVYYKDATKEVYLYHSAEDECYYYYVAPVAGGIKTKLKIDSEDYISYHNQTIKSVSNLTTELIAFLNIIDETEMIDETTYKYKEQKELNYYVTLNVLDGVITRTVSDNGVTTKITVSAIGETEIVIPEAVKKMRQTN